MRVVLPNTPFMRASMDILRQIDATIPETFQGMVEAFLVGGVAVHAYTSYRPSHDLDATFSHKMIMREAPVALYEEDGQRRAVRLDVNYTDAIALLHADWKEDAWDGGKIGHIQIRVISPTDLAVSKIGRFEGNDAADIEQLAAAGLLNADDVERRATEAMDDYIGDLTFIHHNLRDALEIIRTCSPSSTHKL